MCVFRSISLSLHTLLFTADGAFPSTWILNLEKLIWGCVGPTDKEYDQVGSARFGVSFAGGEDKDSQLLFGGYTQNKPYFWSDLWRLVYLEL